jgi:hypothetical protein
VTFEKESHKRFVLSKIDVGKQYIKKNDGKVLENPKYLFQGKVLNVNEPSEPNSVRWQDLNAPQSLKIKEHTFTTLLSFASIYICAVIVVKVDNFARGYV